jgi:hypothetical protein
MNPFTEEVTASVCDTMKPLEEVEEDVFSFYLTELETLDKRKSVKI